MNKMKSKSQANFGSTTNSPILDEPFPFGNMESMSGQHISLKSVSITGGIIGLLFSSTISQEYKNETSDPLEVIYTFPLGWGTALLGMDATIGDKRLTGQVVEKAEAEASYEEAISDGNSAIMLQQSSRGLYTANLGNIKPGETVTIDIHCARLLSIEQGQARLCIPTAIGERYGNPYGPGRLAHHESAQVDMKARYPFTLTLDLHGDMANGEVTCPSHQVAMDRMDNGLHITLDSGAALDRDFVLVMKGLAQDCHALCIRDEDLWMTAASFSPKMPDTEISPLGVKILVDCSSSMSGESISHAQKGLQKILTLLKPDDYVAYSRFGSDVEHVPKTLLPCSHDTIIKLSAAIDGTDADMGGTEMDKALNSTFAIKQASGHEMPPVILLITDGDVWDVKNIIAGARKSGHRIFAIGVGHAPAESLLRDMAEQTGGACEFVTPNENMAEAIVRMFHRMRGKIAKNIQLHWGQQPVWQSAMPKFIYDGETVHAFALLRDQPEDGPILSWETDGQTFSAKANAVEETDNRDLLRLGRLRQMEEVASREEKLSLALKYELVSVMTSLILVYEREDGDKIEGLPKIQQAPQMPAHGHGNYRAACVLGFTGGIPGNKFISMPFSSMFDNAIFDVDQQEQIEQQIINSVVLKSLVKEWKNRLKQLSSINDFITGVSKLLEFAEVDKFIKAIAAETGIAPENVWAAFISWLLTRENGAVAPHSMRLLKMAPLSQEQQIQLAEKFSGYTI